MRFFIYRIINREKYAYKLAIIEIISVVCSEKNFILRLGWCWKDILQRLKAIVFGCGIRQLTSGDETL